MALRPQLASATWTELPATIVSDSEFYQNWVDSGLIELSDFSGNANIAFKYTGADSNDFTGTFELDNFQVLVQN